MVKIGKKDFKGFFKRHIPIIEWLPGYKKKWIVSDLIAGLSVWALVVPQAIGYAGVSGVPPQFGLYAAAAALIMYAIFGTSRNMVTGPSSTVAAVVGSAVFSLTAAGSEEAIQIAASITLFAGLIFILLSIVRMGWISNFIAASVLTGFVFGIAIHIIVGQVPKILGIHVHAENTVTEFILIIVNLTHLNGLSLVVGVGSLALIFLIRRFLPKVPYSLVIFILGILVSYLFNLEALGLEIVGNIPQGPPTIQVPIINISHLPSVLPAAIAVVLVGYSESIAAAKIYGAKYHYDIDPNQELFAQGMANTSSSLLLGISVSGCISKSTVNDQSGGKTQMASLIHAILIILTFLFFAPIVSYLPQAVLAAIIIYSVIGLMEVHEMKRLFKVWKAEFWLAVITLVGVLVAGPLFGVLIGVVLSILILVWRQSKPSIPVLGKNPKGPDYRNLKNHPDYITIPGLVILRLDGPLFFATAATVKNRSKVHIVDIKPPVKMLVLDLESTDHVDIEGADIIGVIAKNLKENGVELHLANVHTEVHKLLEKDGVIKLLGSEHIHNSIEEGVNYFKEKF